MHEMSLVVRVVAVMFAVAIGAAGAHAAPNYPNRPIRVLTPFAPGESLRARLKRDRARSLAYNGVNVRTQPNIRRRIPWIDVRS